MPGLKRLLFAAFIALPAFAGVERWTQVGPLGGEIEAIALQAVTSNVVYAAARGGLFRSADHGATWELREMPLETEELLSLAVHPEDAETVYVGTTAGRLLITTDGGETWQERTPAQFLARVTSIAAGREVIYVSSFGGLHKSTDGGLSWQAVHHGIPVSLAFAQILVDPGHPNIVYVRHLEHGIWGSDDGGATWQARGAGLPAAIEALALDRNTPGVLYAADREAHVWKSTDGGATWSVPHAGALPFYATLLAVSSDPRVIYAASLFRKGILRSVNGGVTWAHLDTGLNVEVHALAPGPNNPQVVYLGSRGSGVLRSLNRGRSWSYLGPAAAGIAHLTIDPATPAHLFAAGAGARFPIAANSMIESREGGRTWQGLGGSNDINLVPYSAITPSPLVPSTLYAGIFEGLAKSRDGGRSWTVLPRPCRVPERIHVSPVRPELLFVESTNAIPICNAPPDEPVCFSEVSHDGGTTRQCLNYFVVALHPTLADTFYASHGGIVRRTHDGGATWSDANPGPIDVLVVDPTNHRRLWATREGKLFRSDDEGDTWTLINDTYEGGLNFLADLRIDPTNGNRLYAVLIGKAVLASDDGGVTFTELRTGLPANAAVNRLVLDPKYPNTLYLATANLGIYRYTRRAPTTCNPAAELCLDGGRYGVRVAWRDFQGRTGVGTPHPLTDDTGLFWFFRPDNLELAVKVLDGTGVNGHRWVFYGALSNVEYRVEVVDTATGEVSIYFNPRRTQASRADTSAFASEPSPATATSATAEERVAGGVFNPCTPGPTTLCLAGGRFRVEVRHGLEPARAVPITGDTGAFWFFGPDNIELFVKVLDGRAVNGKFWVFFGALSNVEYTVTVLDTETATAKTYTNPQGQLASVADTQAF